MALQAQPAGPRGKFIIKILRTGEKSPAFEKTHAAACGQDHVQTIAENFREETEARDEFELEIKRNVLLECGDVLELEKPVFGSEKYSYIPCRLWENKKSLTKVRQSVKLRKLNFD